jgi:hypothetical protein
MRLFLLAAAILAATGVTPGLAADAGGRLGAAGSRPPPVIRAIPRSPEASLVWATYGCWRGCAQDCGRHLRICLATTAPEDCISSNHACDRFCQRECRAYGGPLLPLD